jgi:hypothetical protein
MAIEALGRLFNVAVSTIPVALDAGAQTGKRLHLRDYAGVAFIYVADAGTAGEDVDLDIQEHTLSASGTSQDLDVVTRWFSMRETTLDGDEVWTAHTHAAGSEVDLGADEGEAEVLAVVEVRAEQLSAGFEWVSCNITDPGTTAGKLGAVIAILYEPAYPKSPDRLPAVLT